MEKLNRLVLSMQNLNWVEIGIALLIFIVFLIFRKLFTKYIFRIILALTKKNTDARVDQFIAVL